MTPMGTSASSFGQISLTKMVNYSSGVLGAPSAFMNVPATLSTHHFFLRPAASLGALAGAVAGAASGSATGATTGATPCAASLALGSASVARFPPF